MITMSNEWDGFPVVDLRALPRQGIVTAMFEICVPPHPSLAGKAVRFLA